ncbi:MAG: FkbM family methyltransferase [Planctomycetaceae bacterium]|nr:FkbM family methyltransferase [Planctomycetaceae bacterium]
MQQPPTNPGSNSSQTTPTPNIIPMAREKDTTPRCDHANSVGNNAKQPAKFGSVPILGGVMRGVRWYPTARGKVLRVLCGTYEREQTQRFVDTIRPGDVVFDIGAATGYYTLLAAQLVGTQGRVLSCEPSPRNRYFLTQHVCRNRLTNVTIVDQAVGDYNGTIGFSVGTGTGTGKISPASSLVVGISTLDSLVREFKLCPTHIKLDVEGAEMAVFAGGLETLRSLRPVLFLSTHGEATHRRCCEFLIDLGYQLSPMGSGNLEECTEVYCLPPQGSASRAA